MDSLQWEVLPTPDLNGPIDEDALPFVPDRSDAEIDTQLDENFPPHVHNTSDAVQHLPDEEPATQRTDNHPAKEVQTEQAGPLRTPGSIQFQHRTRPVVDIEALAATATLPSMKQTMCFIKKLKDASLDDPVAKLSGESLERLWNPQTQPISIESVGTQYSIATYCQDRFPSVSEKIRGQRLTLGRKSRLSEFRIQLVCLYLPSSRGRSDPDVTGVE
ncbi:hypothetical protein EDD15DRAFT_2374406 [Pisolithus albus]|nr:hypothetical protein EDD15DRAFT_2374406 [Pisolithus albus]